jgi:hypothetical protein
MFRVCLVSVVLCVLVPLQGLAQSSPPPALLPAPESSEEVPPAPSEEAKPQGEIIPRRQPATGVGRAIGRVALGTFGGLLGGFVGAGPALGLSTLMESCDGCHNVTASTTIALVGVAGGVGGIALGVWGSGALLGGEGRYLPTLLGVGVGALTGGGLAVYLAEEQDVSEEKALLSLVIGPILGGIVGYEISHAIEVDRLQEITPGVALFPTVGVPPSGGVVAGLVGRF